jgi:peroxiredoxin (alkyl hydroperoxide reductase subunit C)
MVSIGDKIPDLEVETYQNEVIRKIRLTSFRGQWLVIIFYPADFTFVCPTELEEAADNYDEFKKAGCEVLSVSTDSVYAHKAWHDQSPSIKKIKYPMASDQTAAFCKAMSTYLEATGVSARATFIVDPDQVIRSIEVSDNSIGRNITETLRKLKAAKFVREHIGKVCPASWHPGDAAITPGLDMVGNI